MMRKRSLSALSRKLALCHTFSLDEFSRSMHCFKNVQISMTCRKKSFVTAVASASTVLAAVFIVESEMLSGDVT
jgi:hypothetical protein